MLKLFVLVSTALAVLHARVEDRSRDERGLGTLEMVVIALGLFLAATAAILAIRSAIDSRTSQIQ